MKKLAFWLILFGGAYLTYRMAEGYWVVGFIGLWLAIGLLFKRLPTGDALRLIGFVVLFMAIMLGGGIVLARRWGEAVAGVWMFVWIVLLAVFQKRIIRMIPVLRIAQEFEDVLKERSRQ